MGEDGEDTALVARARKGDRKAFDRLIQKYQARIFQFCYRMLGDAEEAEELAQDVFIRLFHHLKRFRGEAKFSTWLFQIAKNLSLNRLHYLRRRNFFSFLSLDEAQGRSEGSGRRLDVADDRKGADGLYEARETQQLVQRKIALLRPDYRAVLVLRDIEDMSYAEIAGIMKMAEGTVKSRVHRARLELKNSLTDCL